MSNATGERMTQAELMEALEAPGKNAADFLSTILARLESYAQGMPFPDDMAAIAGIRS